MKQLFTFYFFMICAVITAQETITVDTSEEILGFAEVFEKPDNGGAFVFSSGWGVPDLKTVVNVENNTFTLQPNFNTYADNPGDDFWIDPETGEGNKIFNGITFVESTELVGQELTFAFEVQEFTLDPEYDVTAFIRVFNADFSFNKVAEIPLTEAGEFSVTYDEVDTEVDAVVQYGFTVRGVNANPDDEDALGSVVIGASTLSSQSFQALNLSVYPNPALDHWTIDSRANTIKNVQVYDLTGKLVLEVSGNEQAKVEIDASALNSGVYLANIQAEGSSKSIKLIKK